jgi:hypothetical protein
VIVQIQIQMIRSQMRKKYGDTDYIDFILLFLVVIVLLMLCICMKLQQILLLLATLSKFQQKSLLKEKSQGLPAWHLYRAALFLSTL